MLGKYISYQEEKQSLVFSCFFQEKSWRRNFKFSEFMIVKGFSEMSFRLETGQVDGVFGERVGVELFCVGSGLVFVLGCFFLVDFGGLCFSFFIFSSFIGMY